MSRHPVETLAPSASGRRPLRVTLAGFAIAVAMTLLVTPPAVAVSSVGDEVVILAAEEDGVAESGEAEADAAAQGSGSGLLVVAMIAAVGLVVAAFKMIGSSES